MSASFFFEQRLILSIDIMDLHGQNPGGHIPIVQADIKSNSIDLSLFAENDKFIFPGKAFGIAIGVRNYWNKDETLQLAFQTLVDVIGWQQTIMGVGVEVNTNGFFDGGRQFDLQRIDNSVTQPDRLSLWR